MAYTEYDLQAARQQYRDLTKDDLSVRLAEAEKKIQGLEKDADFFADKVRNITKELTDSKRDLSSFWYSIAIIGKALNVEVPDTKGQTLEQQWLAYSNAIEAHVQKNNPAVNLDAGMDILA